MNIKINKEKCNYRYGSGNSCWYGITISIGDDFHPSLHIILEQNEFNDEDTAYMNIFKFNDEEFFKKNNIDYLIKDDNIIPIGMFDFQKLDKRCNNSNLSLICKSKDKLYVCESIINNIVEAIKIKYKSIEFDKTFNKDEPMEYTIEL